MTLTSIPSLVTPVGSFSTSISVTAAASAFLDAEAFSAANDQAMAISFPYANIKAYWLIATAACTIETNSSSAPDDTISLAAGIPKLFVTGGSTADNAFTANVTSIYVSAAAAGTLTMFVAYDPTP